MDNTQIQILWPSPGVWGDFVMTSVYQDKAGYLRTPQYTAADIPADLAPAIAGVIRTWTDKDAPWRARLVIASPGQITGPDGEDGAPTVQDCINLVVHAEDGSGGRKVFTPSSDPTCIITDPEALVFFRHFTTSDPVNS